MKKQKKIKRNENEVTASKKKAKILIISVLVATLLLVVLNSIDYDKLADKIIDSGSEDEELITYPDYAFKTPVYDEDVTKDEEYMDRDRYVYLKIGNEINQLSGSSYEKGTMERFWLDYFDAVTGADSNSLNSLHTDYFADENGKYGKFAPQKVYKIKVEIISSQKVEEGEYAGCYQYFARVNYNIYENNGTFRNDIKSDESREQIFELIENQSGIKIHTVSYPKENIPTDNEKGFSFMIFVWIALIILSVVIEMMTVSLVAIWFMPAGIVALVLCLFKAHIAIQIGAFVLVGAVLLILAKTLLKNKFVSKKDDEDEDGGVIGKRAIVAKRIDPDAETGAVEIDGEEFDAKMTDGGCAEVGDSVTVVRAQGETLYCERDKCEN